MMLDDCPDVDVSMFVPLHDYDQDAETRAAAAKVAAAAAAAAADAREAAAIDEAAALERDGAVLRTPFGDVLHVRCDSGIDMHIGLATPVARQAVTAWAMDVVDGTPRVLTRQMSCFLNPSSVGPARTTAPTPLSRDLCSWDAAVLAADTAALWPMGLAAEHFPDPLAPHALLWPGYSGVSFDWFQCQPRDWRPGDAKLDPRVVRGAFYHRVRCEGEPEVGPAHLWLRHLPEGFLNLMACVNSEWRDARSELAGARAQLEERREAFERFGDPDPDLLAAARAAAVDAEARAAHEGLSEEDEAALQADHAAKAKAECAAFDHLVAARAAAAEANARAARGPALGALLDAAAKEEAVIAASDLLVDAVAAAAEAAARAYRPLSEADKAGLAAEAEAARAAHARWEEDQEWADYQACAELEGPAEGGC